MGSVTVTGKGRRWLASGHPWVFADDVAAGGGTPGELLPVAAPGGEVLGWGLYSRSSRIAVRLVTRSDVQPDREFWAARLAAIVGAREATGLLDPEGASRLVGGDAEGIPGLVVDRYGRTLVLQCGTQGADRMRDFLLELLLEALPFEPDAVLDRSDASVRRLEALDRRVELLRGELRGPIRVREGEVSYEVDVLGGHKTGAYLDQRENRLRAATWAGGQRVLDAFAYDGLFGIHAAVAGADAVVCLDQSREACERAERNAELNGVADRVQVVRANCMQELRARADAGESAGLVVIDPPAFARNRREARGAERGYVELNRRGALLLGPGGRMVSASCSYNVRPEAFVEHLAAAARLAGRDLWLELLAGASPDHPALLGLPESRYLKCAFLRG